MRDDWIYEREGKTTIGLRQVEKNEGTIASGDVFEAETTSRYLKT